MASKMSLLFVPMEKPAAIRLPKPSDRMKVLPPMREETQDTNYELDVEAMGHILFQCPAVIETYVERWMAHDQSEEESPNDALMQLLMSLSIQRPILQISARTIVNELGRHDGYLHDISFLTNFRHKHGSHDFELSDRLIIDGASVVVESFPDLFTFRLKMLLMGLLCHHEGKSFLQKKINESKTTVIYGGFKYDYILAKTCDRSSYVIALIVFMLRYCATMMPTDENAVDIEELAKQESAFEAYSVLDTFIKEMRTRVGHLGGLLEEIPEKLCVYHHKTHDNDRILHGIPIEIVASETWSFLWLEWMWRTQAWRNVTQESTSDDEHMEDPINEETSTVVGILRFVEDLWRAKSTLLYLNYYEYFEEWDQIRLMPFIQTYEAAHR